MARSREPHIVIDPEFEALIPPLTGEEYNQLKENIYNNGGLRDPIVLWCDPSQWLNAGPKEREANGCEYDYLVIDGHNRWKILDELHKEHPGEYFKWNWITEPFENRTEAMAWMIRNQLGRRNLPNYERARLALRLKEAIAAEAKAKQESTLRQNSTVNQKSDERSEVNTNKELAKVAGVSHDTIHKVDVIEQKAPEEVKEQLRRGEVSINKAYNEIKEKKLVFTNEPQQPKTYSWTNPQSKADTNEIDHSTLEREKLIQQLNTFQTPISFNSLLKEVELCTKLVNNSIRINVEYSPQHYKTEKQKEILIKKLKDTAETINNTISAIIEKISD